MNHFRKVSNGLAETEFSRISSRYLAKLVQQQYGLKKPIYCRQLNPDGVLYEVASAEIKAILRLHEFRLHWLPSASYIGFQYEWANFLRRKGFPVSFPIPAKNGNLFNILGSSVEFVGELWLG